MTPELYSAYLVLDRYLVESNQNSLAYAVNVFCSTGPGGGVDPHCSPSGSSVNVSSSPEVQKVKDENRLSERHLIFGSFTDTHPDTRKQIISTLEGLADRYGIPSGGIHIIEMKGGSGPERASAGVGTRIKVSPEEAQRLKGLGAKTLTLPAIGGGRVHQVSDDSVYTLRIYTNGSNTQAGFNQPPAKYTSVAERKKWTFASGKGGVVDTITHEYGHFLQFIAGHAPGTISKDKADPGARRISQYANENKAEQVAEGFVKYHNGNRESWLTDLLHPYLPSRVFQ
jgi:hypothetical protein